MSKKTEKNLLRDAFVDAMLREVDRDLEKCEESPICSPEHYKRMSEIVGFDVTKPRRKPKISTRTKIAIAIIAAAIVALTSCVAAIYHRQIGNFMEKFYKDHIEVWFDNEEANQPPEEIKDVYTLTYLPEGFKLIDKKANTIRVRNTYFNESGNKIIFEQNIFDSTSNILDSENGNSYIKLNNNIEIYYREIENKYYYKWTDTLYIFSLSTSHEFSLIELQNLINNMQKE